MPRLEAGKDADASDAFDAECPALTEPIPDTVPEGWVPYTCWSPKCPLFVPGEAGQMPPPIEWEPCPEPLPQDVDCRWMKRSAGGVSFNVGPADMAVDTKTGAPLLEFMRGSLGGDETTVMWIVAEVDGPVRTALFSGNRGTGTCPYIWHDLGENRYALAPVTATGPVVDGHVSEQRGVLAGDIDAPMPQTLVRFPPDHDPAHWYVSADWLVEFTTAYHIAWSWDLKSHTTIYTAGDDPDGLAPHEAIVVGKDVFIDVGTLNHCGVMSWNPADGLRPFLRWFGSTTKGAANFGTDGMDLVWTQLEGIGACDQGAKASVWTAPYGTDPATTQAAARRLRSDLAGRTMYPYAVADGFAARVVGPMDVPETTLFIVRLSDGYSWRIEGRLENDAHHWTQTFLSVANGEVFASIWGKEIGTNIVRIRLDSLGPGTPPD
jgi:hypothetical protein